ncbi:MAG: DNA polymerase III subunit delta [Dysgonamonadaceae bacterium]|jgi:DNA polymerase-3 subunit delta|nr:DNA polymerase III subunit delta [Dysgonamonadaceae bacterium]
MAKGGFEDIKSAILSRKYAPVYLFHGEESYYIDSLSDLIVEQAMDDSARDFDQNIFYGADADPRAIIAACKYPPMIAEKRLVVLKEAQNMKDKTFDELLPYIEKPLQTTVFVITYKEKKVDGRKKILSEADKKGVVFESKKLYDKDISPFINRYIKDRKMNIEARAVQMLAEYLGNNLSKLVNEIEKLCIILPEKEMITAAIVEQNIGISKDYNTFELVSALAKKDVLKANRIVFYFDRNPADNPLPLITNTLFAFFSNLMVVHYEADKSKNAIMSLVHCSWYQADDYSHALQNYNAGKTMRIISLLREFDAKSKGFKSPSAIRESLLKELIFKILH